MTQPYIGEIQLFGFNFNPRGWAFCNGATLPISQNTALFSLIGTLYGGNGQTNFALPNLRGRVPIHWGAGHDLGEAAGQEAVTVTVQHLPAHLHTASASTRSGDVPTPAGRVLADSPSQLYADASNLTTLHPSSLTSAGGSQPHNNMQPYLVLNFCIALEGEFPTRD